MLILSLLLGCPATPDGCREQDVPVAELGFGEMGYEPLPAEGEIELVYGSQGGYHLPLAIDAEGLAIDELVVGDFVGTIDGVDVARGQPWLTFRCNPETGSQQTWNILLIFDDGLLPADLHAKTIDIAGTLRDSRLITAEVSGTATILDPES